jgi:hypothetical protein
MAYHFLAFNINSKQQTGTMRLDYVPDIRTDER